MDMPMTRTLLAFLIVLAAVPLSGIGDVAAADGKVFKPRGRCVIVSNRRHRVRITCGHPKSNVERGHFTFGVSIGDAVRSAAAPGNTTRSTPATSPRATRSDSTGCHPDYTRCLPIVEEMRAEG